MKIRLLLVEDHLIVREGLKRLLSFDKEFEVVGEAASVEQAVSEACRLKPQVILMDLHLRGGSGLDACRQIVHEIETHILILSAFVNEKLLRDAIQAGATGYALKHIDPEQLHDAIINVSQGKQFIDPTISEKIVQELTSPHKTFDGEKAWQELSPQEKRVVEAVSEGLTNKEVSSLLSLSEATVRNYLHNVCSKLHLTNRAQVTAFYVQWIHARKNASHLSA